MDIHRCRFVDYTPHTITATKFSHKSSASAPIPGDLRLAVGRSNGDIEIWNPRYNWTHELTLPGSNGRSIEGLCWSTQENETPRLFSIGGSTYITEWDLKTLKPLTNYDCNAGIIWSIDISKDNNRLSVGCDDGSVVIIDISGGIGSLEHDIICQRQDSRVLTIQWFKNELVVGGCADGRIRSWSTAGETKGRLSSTMRVDKSKTESTLVWSIIILAEKRQIVSGDSTGSIKFWDLDNFSLLQSFKVHDADVLCLSADINEEKVFTGGVDRKIHQFNLLTTKNSYKWIHNFNRLLHSNDIRSISIFESKGINFLVSGGVERSIVIQSIQQFHDGKYKKLFINQQRSNVVLNEEKKLVVMFQDQIVKIWKVIDGKHKLVAKLNLAEEENITSVDINDDASLLVVSRLTSVRVFQLIEDLETHKFKVSKFRDDNFDGLIEGAKILKLYSNNKLLVLTPDEEIYKFDIDISQKTITLDDEIELVETETKAHELSYSNSVNNLIISPDESKLVLSRFNGCIEVYALSENMSDKNTASENMSDKKTLTKLSTYPHLIQFSSNNKLIIITEENKLYEFFVNEENNLLTPWSKRNSEFLPQQFLTLEDKPQGMFIRNDKVWIFGSTWVAFFDMSMNIPITKTYKNVQTSKKRNRDGLTIIDESDDLLENVDSLDQQAQVDRLRQQIQDDENDTNDSKKPFWISTKYRPIMKVGAFGENELIVIERPQFSLPTTPAFSVPKLKI